MAPHGRTERLRRVVPAHGRHVPGDWRTDRSGRAHDHIQARRRRRRAGGWPLHVRRAGGRPSGACRRDRGADVPPRNTASRSRSDGTAQGTLPVDSGASLQSMTAIAGASDGARTSDLDAIIIGAGPNGLAAAIALAREGLSVRVYEAHAEPGGGLRSAPLTGDGYINDVCATVHALALASPFLASLPLAAHGFEPVQPDAPFAHPLDDGDAVVAERSIDATVDGLSREDARAYRALFGPLVADAERVMEALLAPPGRRHPLLMARLGMTAVRSARGLAERFRDARTRAAIAGVAAHAILPLQFAGTAGYTIGLALAAHGVGWPIARGGSQALARALTSYLSSLGGEVITGAPVTSIDEL